MGRMPRIIGALLRISRGLRGLFSATCRSPPASRIQRSAGTWRRCTLTQSGRLHTIRSTTGRQVSRQAAWCRWASLRRSAKRSCVSDSPLPAALAERWPGELPGIGPMICASRCCRRARQQHQPARSVGPSVQEVVPPNTQVTGARMGTPKAARAPWHGACAEIVCLDKALNAGVDVSGGTMRAVNIGVSGGGHGTLKAACSSCASVLEFFGVSF
jgi:hypothetical protein